jgi:hypothetical protein
MRRLDQSLLPAEVLKHIPDSDKDATLKVRSAPAKDDEPVPAAAEEVVEDTGDSSSVPDNEAVVAEETEDAAPQEVSGEDDEQGDDGKGLF